MSTDTYMLLAAALGFAGVLLVAAILAAAIPRADDGPADPEIPPEDWTPVAHMPCSGRCPGRPAHEIDGDGTATCIPCGATTFTTATDPQEQ